MAEIQPPARAGFIQRFLTTALPKNHPGRARKIAPERARKAGIGRVFAHYAPPISARKGAQGPFGAPCAKASARHIDS
ncbi:MAG: hypothetical protein RSA12_04660, partial [Clostridia bacterium]